MLASIPSPSDGVLHLGPLDIHAYGLMIALGVVAAVWLAGRRMEAAGVGTRDDMSSIAVWAVSAGVLGARLYYIVTDKSLPWKHPDRWIKVWEGGLGIPGGLLAGIVVAMIVAERRGVSPGGLFTAAAPAVPLAQAIGRIGNWWNQELYGRPTTLPWGLEIDDQHLPSSGEYPSGTLFHPTFLYEALWNLGLMALLIVIGKRMKLRPGRLLVIYVLGYAIGRFWIEGLRIDSANAAGGWRLNQWVSVAAAAGALLFLFIDRSRHRNDVAVDDEDDGSDDDRDVETPTDDETPTDAEAIDFADDDPLADESAAAGSDYVAGDE
ncbi:MAG: prolipoprotein diacylglyceryl transferase [Actinomycetota bacterium]|nr:prolipoprotein diacylglyceryl transferase [Actinomycetota bacterium]